MPRHSATDRGRAIGMLDAGMAARAVDRDLNVNASTIVRLQQCYRTTASTSDRRRSGHPRVTDKNHDHHIRL
jgi:transposase